MSTISLLTLSIYIYIYIYIYLIHFIYLFLAMLDLRCCMRAFHWLKCVGFSLWWLTVLGRAGSVVVAQFCCMSFVAPWRVGSSQTRIKPVSSALAGRFFTTEPPGSPLSIYFLIYFFLHGASLSPHPLYLSLLSIPT